MNQQMANGSVVEINFDGLVGPTHNYGGLAFGNVASADNAGAIASPRLAVKQGLAKMRALHHLGLTQGVLPPHARPHGPTLRTLGFDQTPRPESGQSMTVPAELLPLVMSASAMWTANAATVSPSVDTADHRVHLSPANLVANVHRSIESAQTTKTLRAIFADPERFVVHDPLPATPAFADEGAANHSRISAGHASPGTHVFVYGRHAGESVTAGGSFPRRQTREAFEAIVRRHGIERTTFVRQSDGAVDAGAFHNDVVCVANERVVLCHQDAFAVDGRTDVSVSEVEQHIREWAPEVDVVPVVVARHDVSLDDAVTSYLFNSQLISLDDGSMLLVVAADAIENQRTAAAIDAIVSDPANPITATRVFDLRQSMRNGGGPACLRLRVSLSEDEVSALAGRVIVDDELLDSLDEWADRHYRQELSPFDLADPALAQESMAALDELTGILDLGSIYPFQ